MSRLEIISTQLISPFCVWPPLRSFSFFPLWSGICLNSCLLTKILQAATGMGHCLGCIECYAPFVQGSQSQTVFHFLHWDTQTNKQTSKQTNRQTDKREKGLQKMPGKTEPEPQLPPFGACSSSSQDTRRVFVFTIVGV